MILWQILFVLALAGAFYVINWKVRYPYTSEGIFGIPFPQFMADVFIGLVFLMWLLQAFGVGR